jgi:hypothetical protein
VASNKREPYSGLVSALREHHARDGWPSLWQAAEAIVSQREAIERKDELLRRIARTHMHHGQCAWCDSDVHASDCFVAAAIAETSRRTNEPT